MERSKKWIPAIFPRARFNAADYLWRFPDGELLYFSYLNRSEHYNSWHGRQLPFQGFDELTNWPDMKIYEKMLSCCRSSNPHLPRKMRSTCNPAGPGHNAVKRHFRIGDKTDCEIFEEAGSTRCSIFSRIEENETIVEADPEYIAHLDSLKESNPVYYKAWRLGDWSVVAGGAFDDIWNSQIHVVDPFRFPSGWTIDRSFDWGSSAPFSVLWHAESDGYEFDIRNGMQTVQSTPEAFRRKYPKGTVFTFAEWYGADSRGEGIRMVAEDIARGVLEREEYWEDRVQAGPADSSIYDVHENTSIAEKMAEVGVRWERANKQAGSRINGFQVMRNMLLNATRDPMQKAGWFVMRPHTSFPGYGCPILAEQIPTLSRDEKNVEDVNSAQEDHCYDAARYRMNRIKHEHIVQGMGA